MELTRWQLAVGALALGAALLLPASGNAQVPGYTPEQPLSLLLFRAEVSTGAADAAGAAAPAPAPAPTATTKLVQELTTAALRRSLGKIGISVVTYDKRLPSIQRAVNEGTLRETDVSDIGDDPRKAQRLADIVGAHEYMTAVVEDYKFDATTRMATLNLSLIHSTIDEGATLGTAAAPGKGEAPVDVAPSRQEGAATARAAENAADQAVQGLFPRAVAALVKPTHKRDPKPVKKEEPKPAAATAAPALNVPSSNAIFGRDPFAR